MSKGIFIIAEAGVNHNGNIDIAKKLIDTAYEAGADAVKFQAFKAENIVSKFAPKADYQQRTTNPGQSQYEIIKKLELGEKEHRLLFNYSKRKGIMFLSSPFDLESIDFLNNMGIEIFKIPSGEIINTPYLRKIGGLKKRVIMSSGMSDLKEIEYALNVLTKAGTLKNDIIVLHCNTEYPTPIEDVNLLAMLTIRDTLKVNVGYSDHTLGIEVPIAAVSLGASIIEKHFTLDRNMEGPDHKASLEPYELKMMVDAVRNIEKAIGDGVKKVSLSEFKNRAVVRRSIVAAMNIKKGEIFSERNITAKRPGLGISPIDWDKVIGTPAKRDFDIDELIEL